MNGTNLKAWSAARKAIKSQIVMTCQHLLVHACGLDEMDSLSGDAVADKLIALLDSVDDGAETPSTSVLPETEAAKTLHNFLTRDRVMELLNSLIDKNKNKR